MTMMHICTKFERNPSRNVACRAHTRFPPKYDLWPYKRRNTRGSITKNNRRVDFTKIYLHTKFERNPSRNAAVRAHTRMWRGGGSGITLLNPKYPPAVTCREIQLILATRDTQFGQELALVMQTTHAQRMRSADSIPMCRLVFVFLHWKCTQVLQKSLSLSIKHTCFKRYHHDLLRHLVAFSKFEWFISSDHKIKNFSTHFIHKL